MKVRDVLSHVTCGTQVALYNRRCEPVCSRFSMPVHIAHLESFDYLDCGIHYIDCLVTAEGIPVLAIVMDCPISD